VFFRLLEALSNLKTTVKSLISTTTLTTSATTGPMDLSHHRSSCILIMNAMRVIFIHSTKIVGAVKQLTVILLVSANGGDIADVVIAVVKVSRACMT
jgi:hypothetical protein